MSAKKLAFNPMEAAKGGANHRTNEAPQLDQVIRTSTRQTPGRKADFPGEQVGRLNVFLPIDLIWKVKIAASKSGKTLSQFVAEWASTL